MGKMNNLGISILLFLTVTANAFPKYNGYDQPEYEVLKKLDGYELRRYAPSNWVASEVNALTFDAESSTNFWNLYGYINGGNADSQKNEDDSTSNHKCWYKKMCLLQCQLQNALLHASTEYPATD